MAALEDANVPMTNPCWFTCPKVRDYLATAVSSSGQFQFPGVSEGRLLGWPITSTQNIPTNLGGSTNLSEIYLVDMDQFLIGQGAIEIILGNGTYTDVNNVKQSGFANDETVIRLIAEVDCSLRHSAGAAVLTAVPYGN